MKKFFSLLLLFPLFLIAQRQPVTAGGGGGTPVPDDLSAQTIIGLMDAYEGDTLWRSWPQLQLITDQLSIVREGLSTVTLPEGGSAAVQVTESYLRNLVLTDYVVLTVKQQVPIANDLVLDPLLILVCEGAGHFVVADGKRLTIPGIFRSDRLHVFRGEGHVTLGQNNVYVEWYGAKGNSRFDDQGFILKWGTPSFHPWRRAIYGNGDKRTYSFGPGEFLMDDTTATVLERSALIEGGGSWEASGSIANIKPHFTRTQGGVSISYSYDSITVKGAGNQATGFGLSDVDNGSALHLGPYRRGGWVEDKDSVSAVGIEIRKGRRYAQLINKAHRSRWKPNEKVSVVDGASHFGTEYAQFNRIDSLRTYHVDDITFRGVPNEPWDLDGVLQDSVVIIYFREPWSRDLSLDRAGNNGTTAANFTVPAVGGTVQINLPEGAGANPTYWISIQNDFYSRISADGGSLYTMRREQAGGVLKAGDVVPSGTAVQKARLMYKTPYTPWYNTYEDFYAYGRRDLINASNNCYSTLNRLKLYYSRPGYETDGLWANLDGGYKLKVNYCDLRTTRGRIEGGQIVRSYVGAEFNFCTFSGMKTDFAEFAGFARFFRCDFDYDGRMYYGIDFNDSMILKFQNANIFVFGRTSGEIDFDNCYIKAANINKVFTSAGTAVYETTSGGGHRITNLRMDLQDVTSIFDIGNTNTTIDGVKMTGSARTMFSSGGQWPEGITEVTGTETPDGSYKYSQGGPLWITGLSYTGQLDYVFAGELYNTYLRGTITREGYYAQTAEDVERIYVDGSIVGKSTDNGNQTVGVDIELHLRGWDYDRGGGTNIKNQVTLQGSDRILVLHERAYDYQGTDTWDGSTMFYGPECQGPGCLDDYASDCIGPGCPQ